MAKRKTEPTLGIALSGGIAFCVGHIGVLKAIDAAGLRISRIAGTSGGAVVGACYAAGVPLERIAMAAAQLKWRRIAAPKVPRLGFFSSENIATFMDAETGGITFDELKIPFRAVAVDLLTGDEVAIEHGDVGQAVRASCTIPGVFEPVSMDGRLLVDGGLVNKVPVDVVARMGADIVIASDVSYKARAERVPKNVMETVLVALSFIGEDRARANRQRADFVIYPEMKGLSALSFTGWHGAIRAGENAAREVIPAIEEEIRRRSCWWRFGRGRKRTGPCCTGTP